MVRARTGNSRFSGSVKELFADIAPTYDLCNSLMSLRLHRRWRAHAATFLHLKPGDCALDVCCGTGDFFAPLRRAVGSQGRVFGVDFCLPMLSRSIHKGADGVMVGDATQLPFLSGSVDGVSVGWGIRNVPDADSTHKEIARVLKPGGRFVSIDMARPRKGWTGNSAAWMFAHLVPLLGTLFGHRAAYTYLPKSTQTFKSREELMASMTDAGFKDVAYKDLFFGTICIHWGTKA